MSKDHWQLHPERAPVPIVTCDRTGTIVHGNQLATRLLGVGRGVALREAVAEGADRAVVDAFVVGLASTPSRRAQLRTTTADGTPLELIGIGHEDGSATIVCYDLSAFEDELDQVRRSARLDPLTGLANRLAFDEAAREARLQAGRHGTEPAVLVVDLDQFKVINDSLGHGTGDEVLAHFATRLTSVVSPPELAARFGGDEFVVCIPDGSTDRALAIASLLRHELTDPFVVGGGERVVLTVSCGAAPIDADADVAHALQEADLAMYRAKSSPGTKALVYSPDADTGPVAVRQLTRTVEALRRSATVDARTGLARDHVFASDLPAVLARGARVGLPVSMLLIDLDCFHAFNERYLYEAGHRALHAVASAVRHAVRTNDRCYRYGGEEIAVLLEGADREQALTTAERVRAAIEELAIPHDGVPLGVLTVSVGVVVSDGGRCPAEWMVNGAGAAVFEAKARGRNQISVGEPTAEPARVGSRGGPGERSTFGS